MPDVLTPTQRHRCMSHIRSKATKPEITVRKWLWAHGYRYRLNVKSVPGKPDIVMRRYRTAIFVNGCFWHGHEGCKQFVLPKTNTPFWQAKIDRNREQDRQNYQLLLDAGWQVIVIWACNLTKEKTEPTMQQVAVTLNRNLLALAKKSIYIGVPRVNRSRRLFAMGRAEAGVTSSIKQSGIDFCNLLAEREGDRFQVFFDLYMEGYI